MTREQVGKCSLAYVRAITSTLVRRLSEHLGVPYKDDEETNDEINTVNNKEDIYPLYNEANVKRYGEYKPTARNSRATDGEEKTTFDGSSPDDILAFFSGFTVQ